MDRASDGTNGQNTSPPTIRGSSQLQHLGTTTDNDHEQIANDRTMARPTRQTVDFFLHYCKGGKTLYILEGKYGNDGYAFWFKLLELLGESEGHFYSCKNSVEWEFLLAKTRTSGEIASSIIDTLIDLGKVDAELWREGRIIWIENFVKYLSEVYKRRKTDLPQKPTLETETELMYAETTITDDRNAANRDFSKQKHDRVEKSREEKSREERTLHAHACEEVVAAWNEILGDRLQVVKKLTDERRKKIRLRLGELSKDADDAVRQMRALFERVGQSSFLLGANSSGWVASFDWLLGSSANVVKVLEGNYDNNRSAKAAHTTTTTAQGVTLGVDERIDPTTGRRTYGSGLATIPTDAPARPSARHQWDAASKAWILI